MARWEVVISCDEHAKLNDECVVATKSHATERVESMLEHYCDPDFIGIYTNVVARIYKRISGKDVLSEVMKKEVRI